MSQQNLYPKCNHHSGKKQKSNPLTGSPPPVKRRLFSVCILAQVQVSIIANKSQKPAVYAGVTCQTRLNKFWRRQQCCDPDD